MLFFTCGLEKKSSFAVWCFGGANEVETFGCNYLDMKLTFSKKAYFLLSLSLATYFSLPVLGVSVNP